MQAMALGQNQQAMMQQMAQHQQHQQQNQHQHNQQVSEWGPRLGSPFSRLRLAQQNLNAELNPEP
jgi:hypothetical protein